MDQIFTGYIKKLFSLVSGMEALSRFDVKSANAPILTKLFTQTRT